MLPRPGPGPGLAKICRGRGRDFFNLILKIFESFRKLVSMWASFKVNLEGSYTMFKYNYTKRCLHYYYELALFHCQISSYSFYRHSLLLARASLGTQGSRVMRAGGHISKLVPLGGNFRNAFINPILEILECLNLLLWKSAILETSIYSIMQK